MKKLSLLLSATGMAVASLSAQPFTLLSHTIDGGGGVSSGGRFQLVSTMGQPDARSSLTDGCFSIDPGFWGADAPVTMPGPPTLRVRRDVNYIRVSFPPGCGHWVLQWTRTLAPDPALTVWTDDPAENLHPADGELARDFHIPSWGPVLFFRLRQP
jgi:hypothetical protein